MVNASGAARVISLVTTIKGSSVPVHFNAGAAFNLTLGDYLNQLGSVANLGQNSAQ